MKISFCSIGFQKHKWSSPLTIEQPLREILPAIAAAGCDGVEIWEPHLRFLDATELAEIARQLADLRLEVAMISPYFNFTTSDETAAQSLADARRVLAQARQLGGRAIRVFTGKTASKDATPAQWQRTTTSLQQLADESLADGIQWVAEIHAWNLMDTVESTQRLLAEVDRPNFGIIYHPSNLKPDYLGAIAQFGPAIRHVHATNARDKQAGPLAEGELDYRQIIPQLKSCGYLGYLSIEWFGADPALVAQRETAYLRSLLA
jgi:sugar phosphate isomerase/epimerase